MERRSRPNQDALPGMPTYHGLSIAHTQQQQQQQHPPLYAAVMSDYSGQMMQQQYSVDMGQSPVGAMQRIHSSPQQQQQQQQQQQPHMIQSGQLLSQQQMMMPTNQPPQIHMPPCTSMQVQMTPMGPPQMMAQQGVAMMGQQGQMQQPGVAAAQSTMLQTHASQMMAARQMSPQQQMAPPQIVVTSMGQPQQQQMLSTMAAPMQSVPMTAPTPHLAPQHQPPLPQQQQQQQQQQMMQSAQMMQQQGQAPLNAQQTIAHGRCFAHPSQPQQQQQQQQQRMLHAGSQNYQQASASPSQRPALARFPAQSPESMQQIAAPLYRPPMQRSASTPRVVGQSSAIRQALGHLPPVQPAATLHSDQQPRSSTKLLDKEAIDALVKAVDPMEAVEDDVSDVLVQLIEEFVDDLIQYSARLTKYRNSPKIEAKDVQFTLQRKYKMFLSPNPGSQVGDPNAHAKSPATEAHRQRMALIKKVIQKP